MDNTQEQEPRQYVYTVKGKVHDFVKFLSVVRVWAGCGRGIKIGNNLVLLSGLPYISSDEPDEQDMCKHCLRRRKGQTK